MNRRDILRTAGLLGAVGAAGTVGAQDGGSDNYDTIRVPEGEPTIQAGVDAAGEGDLVLVDAGTYEGNVDIATPGITVRGRDRNAVVLDGGFEGGHGVYVEADGVAVENLTVRNYRNNAVYWNSVEGFRGSYLTAYNNGYYGIYAYGSRDGRFEYSYASGHPDAGFYLGRNQPYDATVANVIAEHNGVGYSGTSTGADLTVRDSVWRHNRAGIVPNTLDSYNSSQHSTHIVDNVVYANDNESAPSVSHMYPTFGTGIALWGGSDNRVEDNVVLGHANFGIAAHHNVVEPSGNVIRENLVRGSGEADLALGTPAGEGNRFEANQFGTSLPPNIQDDASEGDERVTEMYEEQRRRAENGDVPGGDWRDQPEPDPQPTMPDPEAPPRPATRSGSWGE